MYSVLEVLQRNPNYRGMDLIHHFEKELEIPLMLSYLKNEVSTTKKIRHELRVLRAKRMELEEELRFHKSDIDMEVFMQYPPRKGSDVEREHLRLKLQKEHDGYTAAYSAFKDLSRQVVEKEDEYDDIEKICKNARKILETFRTYAEFIKEWDKTR